MGIRIKKEIGYIITKADIKILFVKNYQEVLEELDYEDDKKEVFFQELIKNLKTTGEYEVLTQLTVEPYQKAINEKKLEAYQLISRVDLGDKFKGVLLKTIEHEQISRYDDLIDYYDSEMKDEMKFLYRPIYPMSEYVYNGGLPKEIEEKINIKQYDSIDYMKAKITYLVAKDELEKKKGEDVLRREIVNSNIFTPKVHDDIYEICKSAHILNESIKKEYFNSFCKPVIISSWS